MFPIRYLARIDMEADTPSAAHSGDNGITTDAAICADANGLPMIQGTTCAGVLRHMLAEYMKKEEIEKIFGYQHPERPEESEGSRLVVSSAHLVDENGQAVEGLLPAARLASPYLSRLADLPVRQHCRINHKGVSDAKAHGKFDEEVVPKGVRFRWELELSGNEEDKAAWETLLSLLSHPAFRLGSGTRKGFGSFIVRELRVAALDLRKEDERQSYLGKGASLNDSFGFGRNVAAPAYREDSWQQYTLSLRPKDFWMFGSGFGDADAEMTQVYEQVVEWSGNPPSFSSRKILIPAASVKGALSHRVAYHYNRLTKTFADRLADETQLAQHVGENNAAVLALFGCAKESDSGKGQVGRVVLSDVFLEDRRQTKILNHVALDRFTGGACDSALFQEKVLSQRDEIELRLSVHKSALEDPKIAKAFECALDDICCGMLPLGGGVMRGHGVFQGEWKKGVSA